MPGTVNSASCKGVKVSNAQLAAVNLIRHTFHGDWNYRLHLGDEPIDFLA